MGAWLIVMRRNGLDIRQHSSWRRQVTAMTSARLIHPAPWSARAHLLSHYAGQAVTVEAIVDHVIVSTPRQQSGQTGNAC